MIYYCKYSCRGKNGPYNYLGYFPSRVSAIAQAVENKFDGQVIESVVTRQELEETRKSLFAKIKEISDALR